MKYSYVSILFLLVNLGFSQEYKEFAIIRENGSRDVVQGKLIYEEDLINIEFQDSSINLQNDSIKQVVSLKKDKSYFVKLFKSKNHLFLRQVSGKISIFKDRHNYYLENENNGFLKVSKRAEDKSFYKFNNGVISYMVKNCKDAVEKLNSAFPDLSILKLKKVVEVYNSCELQKNDHIANMVIKRSKVGPEKVKFGASLGVIGYGAKFNEKVDAPDVSNLTSVSVGATLFFYSKILLGSFRPNIFIDYSFQKSLKSQNNTYQLESKFSFLRTMIGADFLIKPSSKISPYLGVNFGLIYNTNPYVTLIPLTTSAGSKWNYSQKSSIMTYNFKVGSIFSFKRHDFDFLVEYQPSIKLLENSSAFALGSSGQDTFDLSGFRVKLTYIF